MDEWLGLDDVYQGDCVDLLDRVRPESVELSVWSPPYFVGKSYERDLDFDGWRDLISSAFAGLFPAIVPGGFVCVNIADILAFPDPAMPRFQADVASARRSKVTRAMVLEAKAAHPDANRRELAKLLGCSEQTVQRRLQGNNVRGGRQKPMTRVLPTVGMVCDMAADAGFYIYDRRIWVKDPAWANDRWASMSYRSVDEFEYILIFWKPGVTKVDRTRLSRSEWREWGSRAVWSIRSVRSNADHEAKFPLELPNRLIRMLTDKGATVLDPFMGSGTTGVAAIRNDRHYIGMEIMPRYADLARFNCANECKVERQWRAAADEERADAAKTADDAAEPEATANAKTGVAAKAVMGASGKTDTGVGAGAGPHR